MINIEVSGVVHKRVEEVHRIINECQHYSNWWKVPVKQSLIDPTYIEFSPIFPIKIGWKKIKVESDQIVFDYVKGPFRGKGFWRFYEIESGKTRISYTIQLKGTNLINRRIGRSRHFERKHRSDIEEIIRRIGRQHSEN